MSIAKEEIFKKGEVKQLASHTLLWFGASVSIAEIYTGAMLAPLGFKTAALAILLGHLVGFVLLYLTGYIGAKTNKAAMAGTLPVFGSWGSKYFAFMNVLQLVGWTAVMIIGGARSVASLGLGNQNLWTIGIGVLILFWILLGLQQLGKLNNSAVILLFGLTIVLSRVVFRSSLPATIEGQMSFGLAFELAIAMPLSWLPLISDYTKQGGPKRQLSLFSAGAYSIGSTWMYLIGLGAALYVGNTDIAQILGAAGLGVTAILIVILSTVTTTFLDVYSAGESASHLFNGFSVKLIAIVVTILGTLVALLTPIENYQNFLYWIGSVFVPMIAIQLTNHYGRFKQNNLSQFVNCCLWFLGFLLYRNFIALETVLGATVPVMLSISMLTFITHHIIAIVRKDDTNA